MKNPPKCLLTFLSKNISVMSWRTQFNQPFVVCAEREREKVGPLTFLAFFLNFSPSFSICLTYLETFFMKFLPN